MSLLKEQVNAAADELETRRRWRFSDLITHTEDGKPAIAADPARDSRPATDNKAA